MDYATLYNKVAASLESGMRFEISVTTVRTKTGPETEWEIWVTGAEAGGLLVEGATADEAYRKFTTEMHDEPESLDQTSAAVGTAEVE